MATSSFGATRGELHVGVARVPDARVDRLSALFTPKKTTFASFEVVDLAGIEKGERQGLDAREFRNADALLHVVRAFPSAAGAAATPRADIVDLETELILADLEVVEQQLQRLELSIRKKKVDAEVREQAVLSALKPTLEAETPIRAAGLSEDDLRVIRGFTFLSQKPILHCLNLSEKEPRRGGSLAQSFDLEEAARPAGHAARLGLSGDRGRGGPAGGEEQAAFLADLGLAEPAIVRVLPRLLRPARAHLVLHRG